MADVYTKINEAKAMREARKSDFFSAAANFFVTALLDSGTDDADEFEHLVDRNVSAWEVCIQHLPEFEAATKLTMVQTEVGLVAMTSKRKAGKDKEPKPVDTDPQAKPTRSSKDLPKPVKKGAKK